jgi:hypothetical protein
MVLAHYRPFCLLDTQLTGAGRYLTGQNFVAFENEEEYAAKGGQSRLKVRRKLLMVSRKTGEFL